MSNTSLSARRISIVSVAVEYPNPERPGQGLFVRKRIQNMGNVADVRVLAPVALLEYSNPNQKWLLGGVPSRRRDGSVVVLHPRWIYPPLGTPLNVLCLCAAVFRLAARLSRRGRCDLIDAHFGYPDGVAAALLGAVLRKPFIVTLRGNEPIFAQSALRRWCLKWALRRAGCVVAVSEQLRQFAIACGVDPQRTRVIGNGVDTSIFHPRDRAACRSRHAIPAGARVILSAGSLLKAKGHHHVIAAVAELAARGLDCHLVLAGGESRGGPGFEKQLRAAAAALGIESRVQFAGWVPPETMAELMCAADMLCLASDSEGWPNVVHEALSCGTPVVSTDVGSVRELIPSDRFGVTVPVGNQPVLVTALERAAAWPWDREAIAAWGQSRSWDRVTQEVFEVVEDVLDRSEAGGRVPARVTESPR